MKQKLLMSVLFLLVGISLSAKEFVNFEVQCPDGNIYRFYGSEEDGVYVFAVESERNKYTKVDIPPTVSWNGKSYKVVGINDFDNCKNLKHVKLPASLKEIIMYAFHNSAIESIEIPNSVNKIERSAFQGCKSLVEIKLPDNLCDVEERTFCGCHSLKKITLPSKIKTIREDAFYGCQSLIIIQGLSANVKVYEDAFGGCPKTNSEYLNSFENILYNYIVEKIKEWQKKRDFETTAQYKVRVTKENQQKKIKELTKECVKLYTTHNKLEVSLGDYDADFQIYALNSNYGQKYVKVPLSQAPAFKNNFKRAMYNASYVPTEEGLKIDNLAITLNGKKYVAEKTAVEVASNNIDIDLPEIELGSKSSQQASRTKSQSTIVIDNSLDQNIPANATNNKNTFAVIIGNERYTQVAHVPYANNDARIFAEYCKKTLGLPDKNVKMYENASYGTMIGAVSDIQKIAKAYKGDINVIFYYAGHGIPDEATGDGYLLPIDADGLNMRVCYPLSQLYKELGEMQVESVTCFMDACFSGAQRGNGMIVAARGVVIKPKADHPMGNTVVFTAATDKQTAYPYEEKGHGMFTYYLLKKLRETKGDCTLGELGAYICDEVAKQAVVTNGKEQTPVVLTSQGIANDWKNLKLK